MESARGTCGITLTLLLLLGRMELCDATNQKRTERTPKQEETGVGLRASATVTRTFHESNEIAEAAASECAQEKIKQEFCRPAASNIRATPCAVVNFDFMIPSRTLAARSGQWPEKKTRWGGGRTKTQNCGSCCSLKVRLRFSKKGMYYSCIAPGGG